MARYKLVQGMNPKVFFRFLNGRILNAMIVMFCSYRCQWKESIVMDNRSNVYIQLIKMIYNRKIGTSIFFYNIRSLFPSLLVQSHNHFPGTVPMSCLNLQSSHEKLQAEPFHWTNTTPSACFSHFDELVVRFHKIHTFF